MKLKFYSIALFLGGLSFLVSSYSTGYTNNTGGDATGASGTATCGGSGCHSNSATAGITVSIELDSSGVSVTKYHPGASYIIKITGTNTTGGTLPVFGFGVATVTATGAGTVSAAQAGNFGTLPAGVQTSVANGALLIAEHQAPFSATSGSGGTGSTYVQSLPWTAPSAGTGTVKIYGVINAVNGDALANTVDKWNSTSKTITEFGAPNGINDVATGIEGFKVYPTVAANIVTVAFDLTESASVSAELISLTGQVSKTLISSESLSTGAYSRSYDLTGLSAGTYLVRVQAGDHSSVSKIVKQ